MKVLDLFSGFGGWSQAFVERKHDVTTVDIDPSYHPSIVADVFDFDLDEIAAAASYARSSGSFDVILASPPCTRFTVMNIGRNWTKDGQPRNEESRIAAELVRHTVRLIEAAAPKWFFIENPRAKLRSLDIIPYPRVSVCYCRYGERRMKPTDIWGRFPPTWTPRPMCANGNPDHDPAPRGAKSSQGINAFLAAKVPYELSLEICIACESVT